MNDTRIVVDLPIDKEAIGCKRIYKIQFNVDGSTKWYNARLVAKMVSTRTLLAIVAVKG